jgi:transcriptional regulator with XRE-family HTH domain
MASEPDRAEFTYTKDEVADLTDAELVGRTRSINAEIERLRQVYLIGRPEHERIALPTTVLPLSGAEIESIQGFILWLEMELRQGEMLRLARLALGLDLREVAGVADINPRSVHEIEQGPRRWFTNPRSVYEIEQGRRRWSTNPDLFERACTEGRLQPADCTLSLSLWSPLADPRLCRTIREVAVDPAWLSVNDGVVATLVRSIRENRTFDLLPILGDALEEAGCGDLDLLAHCRSPGLHARGCWVVDALVRAGRHG